MIAYLIAAATASAQPVTLWQGVKAGMGLQQLQSVRPAARVKPDGEEKKWTSTCTFVDDPITIGGVTFRLCYEAPDNKIEAVLLHSEPMEAPNLMDGFKGQLATKYGRPVLDGCETSAQRICRTVWNVGKISVLNKTTHIQVLKLHWLDIEYRLASKTAASQL
jgi:hypothetical protein